MRVSIKRLAAAATELSMPMTAQEASIQLLPPLRAVLVWTVGGHWLHHHLNNPCGHEVHDQYTP